MTEDRIGHLTKLPIEAIKENVDADPKVPCTEEVLGVLQDLRAAVDEKERSR